MLASYCGICGKPFQSTDTFCAGCGTPRDETNVSNTTLVSAPNAPTVLNRTALASLGRMPHAAESATNAKATGAGCEIELPDGRLCGVTSLGRCATCGRAFCRSHLARWEQAYDINQCAPCLAKAQANEEKAEAKRKADEAEARKYIQSGSARIALLTSGVQPVNIYQTRMKMMKGFFSRNNQWVEEIASVRRGWILGAVLGGLTALLDVDHPQVVLIPVEPYAESYKEVDQREPGLGPGWTSEWIEAAQAVRQLIMLRHLGIHSIFTRRIFARQGEDSSERMQTLRGRSAFIRIEEGKEPGRMYAIQKEEFSIGRSQESDIFLEDSARDELSADELLAIKDELLATIIHQGNGNYVLSVHTGHYDTRVNGQLLPLNRDQTYPLQHGDHIQLSVRVTVFDRMEHGALWQPDKTVFVFEMK